MAVVEPAFWQGKRVFLTGHTGFKGSWLSLWLQAMGARVFGLALAPPTSPALFDVARVGDGMESTIGDIRDFSVVSAAINQARPDIVIHMAAQPLVRLSYDAPVETYATNVMGTVHVLEAARHASNLRAVVNVTTDKCYENREWFWGYREDEPMGGFDPYSNSKGCSELATSAFRRSFFRPANIGLASARAGNVIGGGDWAADRLVPDILRSFERDEPVKIRNSSAIRPWQHVLEPLSGYLVLAQKLYDGDHALDEPWNFGPRDEDAQPVGWIVEQMAALWGPEACWQVDGGPHPHEAHFLKLDISKAHARLGWAPKWNLSTALHQIIDWHRSWLDGKDMKASCLAQIEMYQNTNASPARNAM